MPKKSSAPTHRSTKRWLTPRRRTAPTRAATSAQEKLSVEVPAYLLDAIRLQAAKDRSSIRYVLMSALRAAGFNIKAQDIFANGRRTLGRSAHN